MNSKHTFERDGAYFVEETGRPDLADTLDGLDKENAIKALSDAFDEFGRMWGLTEVKTTSVYVEEFDSNDGHYELRLRGERPATDLEIIAYKNTQARVEELKRHRDLAQLASLLKTYGLPE
jgi:hypothetical protein